MNEVYAIDFQEYWILILLLVKREKGENLSAVPITEILKFDYVEHLEDSVKS